jgi:hypothetical protein
MQKNKISFFLQKGRFKLQINLDRHGLRPLPNISHLPAPSVLVTAHLYLYFLNMVIKSRVWIRFRCLKLKYLLCTALYLDAHREVELAGSGRAAGLLNAQLSELHQIPSL